MYFIAFNVKFLNINLRLQQVFLIDVDKTIDLEFEIEFACDIIVALIFNLSNIKIKVHISLTFILMRLRFFLFVFIINFWEILLKNLLVEVKARAQQTRDVQSTIRKKDSRIKTKALRNKNVKTILTIREPSLIVLLVTNSQTSKLVDKLALHNQAQDLVVNIWTSQY